MEVNDINISIGTRLGLETIFNIPVFDKEREVIRHNIDDYDIIVINVVTLVRNIYNGNKKFLLSGKIEIKKLISELFAIRKANSTNKDLFFYMPNYEKIQHCVMDEGEIKNVNVIIVEALRESKTLSSFLTDLNNVSILNKRKIVVSHMPVDLLMIPNSILLETHTGAFKGMMGLNTKLKKYKKNDMSNIPFNILTLLIFGDNHFFKGSSLKLRNEVFDMSLQDKWKRTTDLAHTRLSIRKIYGLSVLLDREIKKIEGKKCLTAI